MSFRIDKHTCISLILQLTIVSLVSAQSEIKVPRRSLKLQNEGFLDAYFNVMDGDVWARRGKGAVSKALEFYLKAYEYNKDCPELNYKIGLCYLRSDKKANALEFLEAAHKKKPSVAKDILYLLGRAYQYNLEFDKAIAQYDAFYNSLKNRQKKKLSEMIYKNIEECKAGKDLAGKPVRAAIKNLGGTVNSVYDDYNALLLGGDSIMFFTTRRPNKKRERPDRVNYMFDEDIYIARNKNGEWGKAEYLEDGDLNTKHHEAIVWSSEDGKTRYLYDGFRKNGNIYVTTYVKERWKHPRKIKGKLNTRSSETSMTITKDGNTIYYVTDDDAKDNQGGKDIYYSVKKQNGKWGKPKNIGSTINTAYDEATVYIKPDGKVLFFSSKGHNTMGGYDIFRSEKIGSTWSKPQNIGSPVNTPDDELFYQPFENEKVAYFSAKRPDTKGNYDLYKVTYLGKEKKMMLSSEDQLVAYFYKPISETRASEEIKIDSAFFMKGSITDAKRSTPVMAKLNLIDIEQSQVVATTMSDAGGAYRISLPSLKKYGVEISAKDYMFFLDVITLPTTIPDREIIKNFALTKLEVGAKIILKNIYFETGKAILTKASNTELDKLVAFLQENNDIKVEISGHTDNVGTLVYNTKLSESRAKAVVTYLVNHGIPQEQLVYKGYAFSQPMAPNTTKAGRQLNRRVEFKILSRE